MNKFHGDIKQRDTSEMFCRIYEPTCWTPHLRVTRCGRETSLSTQFPGSSFFLSRKSTLLSRGRKRGPWERDCITLINGEKVCALVTVKASVLNVQLKIPPLSRQLSIRLPSQNSTLMARTKTYERQTCHQNVGTCRQNGRQLVFKSSAVSCSTGDADCPWKI